jgi:hypothetical protein
MHIFRLFGALLQKSIQATSERVYEKNERKVGCPGGFIFAGPKTPSHFSTWSNYSMFIKIRTIRAGPIFAHIR